MRKTARVFAVACLVFGLILPGGSVLAQEKPAGGEPESAVGDLMPATGAQPTSQAQSGSLWHVMVSSGLWGIVLWFFLFATAGAAVYFAVDCAITVRAKRIMPQALVDAVTAAMAEGDVIKALQSCEKEPGPLANILSAGFSHVEEGYDVIQEAISTAADLETERIMQRLTWLSVVAAIAPMLGLLGTVQGMIAAFFNLATGAPDIGLLALAIGQALYTTAVGLCIAIPTIAIYYAFRNVANRIVLRMEAMTIELIKDLRNVEVVKE